MKEMAWLIVRIRGGNAVYLVEEGRPWVVSERKVARGYTLGS